MSSGLSGLSSQRCEGGWRPGSQRGTGARVRQRAGPGLAWAGGCSRSPRRSEEAAGDPSVDRELRGARGMSTGLGSPVQTACRAGLGSAAGWFPRTRSLEAGSGGQGRPLPRLLGPVEEGSARAASPALVAPVGALPRPRPPSCRALGSPVNWGCRSLLRAGPVFCRVSLTTRQRNGVQGPGGFAGRTGLGGT